jgi:hypothetical protein
MTKLSDLVATVRERTDKVNSQFVTDPELVSWLNSSLAELYDLLATTYEDYQLSVSTPIVVAGGSSFPLPADFYKLRGVDREIGSRWVTLFPYSMQQRNRFAFPFVNVAYGYLDIFYRLQGNVVQLIPTQNASAVYQLWYTAKFAPLASGDDLPSYLDTNAWHEYAVADCCAKVKVKEDLDPSIFLVQKQALGKRIVDSARPRDAGPPKHAEDTRDNNQFWPGGYGRGGGGWL